MNNNSMTECAKCSDKPFSEIGIIEWLESNGKNLIVHYYCETDALHLRVKSSYIMNSNETGETSY